MKVSELLESRQANWRELERMCGGLQGRSQRKIPAPLAGRFAALYRAACADLALADAYQLPPGTVQYLHQLVGRAHNLLYRSQTFNLSSWWHELVVEVPQRLFQDNCLRLAFAVFWGVFTLTAALAYTQPDFARQMVGEDYLSDMEENFSRPVHETHGSLGDDVGGGMVGFYINNNTGIGLRCFAFGLVFGIGGLFATVFNAALIGMSFGYMATVSNPEHFFHFVTAHGPFELTAIVLSAAAGMRLGFSLVDTRGYSRAASLRRAAKVAMPTMGAAIVMFFLAALIEGLVSPSALPYWVKAGVAIVSSGMLMFYFVVLGYPQGPDNTTSTSLAPRG